MSTVTSHHTDQATTTAPSVAELVAPLVHALARARSPDPRRVLGRQRHRPAGRPGPPARCTSVPPMRIRRIMWSPNELGLARAYVAGDLDVDGDLYRLIEVLRDSTPEDMRFGSSAAPAAARAARKLGLHRPAAAAAARGGPAEGLAPLAAARRRGHRAPLRRRQRLLPARAGPGDDVLVRPLRRADDGPRRRPGGQARADLPQARARRPPRRADARRRVRLGLDGHPRRHPPRRVRRRHHDQRGPGGAGPRAGRRRRRRRPGRDPAAGLPAARRRAVRRHLVGRHVRARRREAAGPLLRGPPRRAARRRAGCSTTPSARPAAPSSGGRRSSGATCSPTAS